MPRSLKLKTGLGAAGKCNTVCYKVTNPPGVVSCGASWLTFWCYFCGRLGGRFYPPPPARLDRATVSAKSISSNSAVKWREQSDRLSERPSIHQAFLKVSPVILSRIPQEIREFFFQ